MVVVASIKPADHMTSHDCVSPWQRDTMAEDLGEEQVNGAEDVQVDSFFSCKEREGSGPVGSEVATGQEESESLSDDISDTGWDTDLDVEGIH